jgi:hypothetical protein
MSGLAPGGMFSSIQVSTHLKNRLLMTAYPFLALNKSPFSGQR